VFDCDDQSCLYEKYYYLVVSEEQLGFD